MSSSTVGQPKSTAPRAGAIEGLLDPQEAARRVQARLPKRYRDEKLLRLAGVASLTVGLGFLVILLSSVVLQGLPAFTQTHVALDIRFDEHVLVRDGDSSREMLARASYGRLVRDALDRIFPGESRRDRRSLYRLVSTGAAYRLRDYVLSHPQAIGTERRFWLPADEEIDLLVKGYVDRDDAATPSRLSDKELAWVDELQAQERIKRRFNLALFSRGDSRDPELAGILGATMGSALTLLVTLLVSFPIGVAASIYLEEFAPKNRITDIIEVNINNLAAVPSIVFGLLGLALFIDLFGLPRSAPLVGGLVLSLMTLPTIIISSRAALKTVPPSIRDAALGLGASRTQVVTHHVLPLAMPGMLTGTIIGMARALGETAPLLMIGMVAFVVDVPASLTDPSTVLPVQIYLWADSPERAFVERTSAAIMVLLVFLIAMNGVAVYLRRRFEQS
ncbi:MAG: phosphate ABC transporter permease PstA [Pseudomonadota bacterium]